MDRSNGAVRVEEHKVCVLCASCSWYITCGWLCVRVPYAASLLAQV